MSALHVQYRYDAPTELKNELNRHMVAVIERCSLVDGSAYVSRPLESLSTRQAQRHKPPAAMVMSRKNGSLTTCGHSMKIRKRCARVSSAKTTPVVITYAFIESPPVKTGPYSIVAYSYYQSPNRDI